MPFYITSPQMLPDPNARPEHLFWPGRAPRPGISERQTIPPIRAEYKPRHPPGHRDYRVVAKALLILSDRAGLGVLGRAGQRLLTHTK